VELSWRKVGKRALVSDGYRITAFRVPNGWKYTLHCWGRGTLGHALNNADNLKQIAQADHDKDE
jgi:hypothetical protein